MATRTITTGLHYIVETAAGEWCHVDASKDEEWKTWGASLNFGAHAEPTPEDALRRLAPVRRFGARRRGTRGRPRGQGREGDYVSVHTLREWEPFDPCPLHPAAEHDPLSDECVEFVLEERSALTREKEARERAEAALRDFLTLTWWAELGGVAITFKDDRRSGTEVRELINLRSAARAALTGPGPTGGTPT